MGPGPIKTTRGVRTDSATFFPASDFQVLF